MSKRNWLTPQAVAILLALGAALYAIGAIAEASVHQPSTAAQAAVSTSPASGGETGNENTELHSGTVPSSSSSESVAGFNLETPAFVGGAILTFLALALALWVRPARLLLIAAAGLTLIAAILDIREVAHQLADGRTLLVVAASVLIIVHLATAGAAGASLRPVRAGL